MLKARRPARQSQAPHLGSIGPGVKVLVLGNNYKPEPTGIGVITTEFAELLAGRGHDVTVVTTFPHYPQWRWHGARRWVGRENSGGVSIRRLWTPLPRNRSALWRIVFDSGFALTSLVDALGAQRPEVIVAVCPPVQVALTARALGALWRVPTVLWVKDLPLNAAVDVGLLPRDGLAHRVGDQVERLSFKGCDRLVVLHDRFADILVQKGVQRERILSIPNWVGETALPAPSDEYRRSMGATNGEFVLLHAGNMGAKQDLGNVVAAARALHREDSIKFAFIGDGSRRAWLEAEIAEAGLENVSVLPLQPAGEVATFFASADALLLNQGPGVSDSVVPMKLLSYMAARKPILAAVNPASITAEIVNQARCGLVVDAGRPEALANAARQLARSPEISAWANNAASYAAQHFAPGPVIDQWENMLTALVHKDSRRRTEGPAIAVAHPESGLTLVAGVQPTVGDTATLSE